MYSSAPFLTSTLEVQHIVRTLFDDAIDERLATVLVRIHRISNELVRLERRSSREPLRMFSCVVGRRRYGVDREFLLGRNAADMAELAVFGVILLSVTDISLGNCVGSTPLGQPAPEPVDYEVT